jgi:hypothetical protein
MLSLLGLAGTARLLVAAAVASSGMVVAAFFFGLSLAALIWGLFWC